MTKMERKALIETVRLEAELNANYDGTAFKLLHRIGRCIETDGQRIEAQAAENARLLLACQLAEVLLREPWSSVDVDDARFILRAALTQETQPCAQIGTCQTKIDVQHDHPNKGQYNAAQ